MNREPENAYQLFEKLLRKRMKEKDSLAREFLKIVQDEVERRKKLEKVQ